VNLRTLAFAAPLLALAACGSSSTTYTLSSGTYKVAGATTTSTRPTDQCGLLAAYQDPAKVIGIVVSGSTASFNLANDPTASAASIPTATVNGNAIEVLAEANYVVGPFGNDCNLRIHRRVTGELTANDATRLDLTFEVARESGTCVVANTPFAALPCQSGYEFLATKQ
jgi:hypothetical protein